MHSYDSTSSIDPTVQVPPFLKKLWRLVESEEKNLICWGENGQSFIIKDPTRFANELLPDHFKHRNMSSFIRQLNMYGFRKIPDFEKSSLNRFSDELEFQNNFFVKGKFDLLELIKRKPVRNNKSIGGAFETAEASPKDLLLNLTTIRERQESVDVLLEQMKKENELLWRELTTMRQKHKQQEQIIQTVIQFLVSLVQRSGPGSIPVQRKFARMLQDKDSLLASDNNKFGPVIHEVTDDAPFTKNLLDALHNSSKPLMSMQEGESSTAVSLPGKTTYLKLPAGSKLITLPQGSKTSRNGVQILPVNLAQLKNATNNVIALQGVPNSNEKMLVVQPSTSSNATLSNILNGSLQGSSAPVSAVSQATTSPKSPLTVNIADSSSSIKSPVTLVLDSNIKSPAVAKSPASVNLDDFILPTSSASSSILAQSMMTNSAATSKLASSTLPKSPAAVLSPNTLSKSPRPASVHSCNSIPNSPATGTLPSPEPTVILPDTPTSTHDLQASSIADDLNLPLLEEDLGQTISIPDTSLNMDDLVDLSFDELHTYPEDSFTSTSLNTPLVTPLEDGFPGLFSADRNEQSGSMMDSHDSSYLPNMLQNNIQTVNEYLDEASTSCPQIKKLLQLFEDGGLPESLETFLIDEPNIKKELIEEEGSDTTLMQEGGKRKSSMPGNGKRRKAL